MSPKYGVSSNLVGVSFFFEHVADIDKVIVGKVFGERSVIRVQHYPEKFNVMAGVVRKT